MRLATRLTIVTVTLVLGTAAMIGVFIYRSLEAFMVPRALERIEWHARLLATDFEADIRRAHSDALSMRGAPAIDGFVLAYQAGGRHPVLGSSEAMWRKRVAELFVPQLEAKP